MSNKYVWAIIALVLMTVALVVYRLRPKAQTDVVINTMKETVNASQERANEIVTDTEKKEVAVRAEARKNTALLTDDELLNVINEMLGQYRASVKN